MKKILYFVLMSALMMVACGQKNKQEKGPGDTIRHIVVKSMLHQVDSMSVELYKEGAVMLYGDGRLANGTTADTIRLAVELFRKSIATDSGQVLAYNTLVQAYHALGQDQEALSTLAEMEHRFADYPDVYMLHAFLLDVMKQPDEAEKYYRCAIAKWDSLLATGGIDVSMVANRALAVSMVDGQKKFVSELISAIRSNQYNVSEREMLEELVSASREPYSRYDLARVTIQGGLKKVK